MNELSTCTLRDGRQYAWAEYGDPGGLPVLFLHGEVDRFRQAGLIAPKSALCPTHG